MKFFAAILLLPLLYACGPSTTEADASDDECAGLDARACIGADGCTIIGKTRYDKERACRYWSSSDDITCTSAAICFDEPPFARDLDGRTWMMHDLCIPPGWTKIEEPSGGHQTMVDSPICSDLEDPCADLSEETCQQTLGCAPLLGTRLDRTQGCRSPIGFATCTGAPGCGDGAILEALDPEGQPWSLANYCLPLGWTTNEPLSEEDRAASDGPLCPAPPDD